MFKWIMKHYLNNLNKKINRNSSRYIKFKIIFKTCTGKIVEYTTDSYYRDEFDLVEEGKYIKIEKRKYPINNMEWIDFIPIDSVVLMRLYDRYYKITESHIKEEIELRNYHIERCNKYGVDCIFGKELIL